MKNLVAIIVGVGTIMLITQIIPAYADDCSMAIPCYDFDATSGRYVTGHGAVLEIHTAITDQAPTINVRLTSTGGGIPIQNLDLTFNRFSPGIYTFPTFIKFSSSNTENSTPNLKVGIGSTVTAKVLPSAPLSAPQTIMTNLDPSIPPSSWGSQPNFVVDIACDPLGDTDGDSICDSFEQNTINNTMKPGLTIPYNFNNAPVEYYWRCSDNPADYDLIFANPPVDYPCPSSTRKDVYVEINWMQNHGPDKNAINAVRQAFENAQDCNIDGSACLPVRVHFLLDDEIGHQDSITGPFNGQDSSTSGYNKIKKTFFGTTSERTVDTSAGETPQSVSNLLTAKRQAFHYMFIGHKQCSTCTSSGKSEMAIVAPWGGGNDILISLGSFSYGVGTSDQQKGAFMHELGHNLGLDHGGPNFLAIPASNNINCKPNYLSVMSWSRTFSDLFTVVGERPIDYSREEISLSENPVPQSGQAVSIIAGLYTVYGTDTGSASLPVVANSNINWGSGNHILHRITPVLCPTSAATNLIGYNDWNNLQYEMTLSSNYQDGPSPTTSPADNTEMYIIIALIIILLIIIIILLVIIFRMRR